MIESDATATADLVKRGEVSAEEAVRAALGRLAERDPGLRAFTEVRPERAVAAARRVDAAVRRGGRPRLAGVPIGVKAWPRSQSAQTPRLEREGCVVVGLTSVPDASTPWQTWGRTERGPTVNPWRPDRTPGGSSAGSAAAVAAGVVPLATGSDGAGSLRIPAAWCGLVGLKPTNRRLPARDRAGLAALGALTRTARDTALYLSVMLGEDLAEAAGDAGGPLRAAWSSSLGYAEPDAGVEAVARAAAGRLREAGAIAWGAGRAGTGPRLLDPGPAWHALRAGRDGAGCRRIRAHNGEALDALFGEVDVLLTPATPTPPHGHQGPGEAMTVDLTWAFNVSGHPAVSVPAGLGADGTPVGLQAVAAHGREAVLLRVAAALEAVTEPLSPALAP
ncbi:amidase [Spirillospora sp. NPDC029432]|uniref:amidase n=1 Tax=Spirillospora sp. NPDC029432 TaxID=3154599 RepID=UPI003453EAB3